MKLKSLILCRVSSAKQVKEWNWLPSQEKRCRDYSADILWIEVEKVFYEEWISGWAWIFERKGIQEINKALFLLSKNYFNCEFHFVGLIPEKKKIHSDKLKIIYNGLIIDEIQKKKLYDNCDVLLCPSYSEGMPNVVLEAMSRGLIIIATDVGAMNTLVSSDNGILIKDCKSSLIKDAIEKINLSEKKLILKMKYNSVRKIRENFSWPNVLNTLTTKIENIL